jgi:hypothetical protein
MKLEYALKASEDLKNAHPDCDIANYASDIIKELVDDIAFIRPVDPPDKALERKKKIRTIVNYYINNREGNKHDIREMLEYYWNCMSDYTLDDYVEIVEESKKGKK